MGAMESRSTTFGSEIEGETRRALIMGGWSEENPAQSTLEAARNMISQLRLDIDDSTMFVPPEKRRRNILAGEPPSLKQAGTKVRSKKSLLPEAFGQREAGVRRRKLRPRGTCHRGVWMGA